MKLLGRSRRENALAEGDERILGDGDFVEAVLAHATESLNRKHHLRNKDPDLETIIQRIGDLLNMTREEVLAAGENRRTVHARSLLCHWTVDALDISMTGLSARLEISVNAVSKGDKRQDIGKNARSIIDLKNKWSNSERVHSHTNQ